MQPEEWLSVPTVDRTNPPRVGGFWRIVVQWCLDNTDFERGTRMPVRRASAEWKGDLATGTGTVLTESGAVQGHYSFPSRFESGEGTNPEELIGAAHAACFSMAFSHGLAEAGYTPESVRTEASVHLTKGDAGFAVSRIDLDCVAQVPGIDEGTFQDQAQAAKKGCPISGALAAVDIHLNARLA